MKTAKEYQDYFEKEFKKKLKEIVKENEDYNLEDAGEDATAYFFGDECTDYDAIAGMYIDYRGGDAKLALKDFKSEIEECREDGELSEYDIRVIEKLEQIIAYEEEINDVR